MKKYLLSALLTLTALSISAQREAGSWSVIPRLGANIANINGVEVRLNADNDETISSKFKAGMTLGADLEYTFINNLSASIGAYYAMQGTKFDDYVFTEGTKYTGHNDTRINTQYINVPLMIHYYIVDGLAVNAGVQVGFLLDAKTKTNTSNATKNEDGTFDYEKSETQETNVKNLLKSTDISIPIGISYEYENVLLDARYNIGITSNVKEFPEAYFDKTQKWHNNSIVLTVGYRFNL